MNKNSNENNDFPQEENVDVSKLSDRDAEIHEKLQALFDTCQKYDVTAFLRIILNSKGSYGQFLGTQTVPRQEDKMVDDYKFLLSLVAKWISSITNGKYQVVEIDEKTE